MEPDVEVELRRAEALRDSARPAEAARLLTEVLAARPDLTIGWCLLANCRADLNDLAGMVAAAERARQLGPTEETAHRVYSVAMLRAGRPHDAAASAQEAIRLAPDQWLGHFALALALQAQRRYRDAWRVAVRARDLAPDLPDVHVLCGDLLHDMADDPAARTSYTRALAIDPTNHEARHNLAVVDIGRGRVGRAAAGFGAAVASEPTEAGYAASASIAARASLWRLVDLAAVTYVATGIAVGVAEPDRVPPAVVGTLALGWYAWVARRRLTRAPHGIRAAMRHQLRRPMFALAVVGVAATLLATVSAAYLPPGLTETLAVPGALMMVVVLFRVRNWLLRGVYRWIRRTWHRIGRRPRS